MHASTVAPSAPPQLKANRWLILTIVCLADFMVILDSAVVNVALPSIQGSLGFSYSSLQWVVNVYTLLFGGFLLLGGRSGDLFGRQRLFITGMAIFTGASLLSGAAENTSMMIAGRALQGFGAALVAPTTLSIVITTFADERERGRAIAIWSAMSGGGAAVGLIAGGILTDALSWRWVFYINIPIGIAAITLGWRFLTNSRDETASRSIDVAGALTVTGGLLALIYAIVRAQEWGWTSLNVMALGVVAAALFTAFVLIELRSEAPLIRLNIFRNRSLSGAAVVMFMLVSGLFAMFYFTSLYFQEIQHYSPLRAGFAFLPMPVGIVAGSTQSARLSQKFGTRAVLVTGLLLDAIGFFLLTQLPVDGAYVTNVLPSFFIMAVGAGLVFPALVMTSTSSVAESDAGLASGVVNTSQQVGGALGLAILATLAASRTSSFSGVGGASSPEALVSGFHLAYGLAGAMAIAAIAVFIAFVRVPSAVSVRAIDPALPEADPA